MVLTASTRRNNKSNGQQATSLTSSPVAVNSTSKSKTSSPAVARLNKKTLKSLKSKKKKSLRLKNGKESSSLNVDKQRSTSNSIKKAKLLRFKSQKELTKSSHRLREKHLTPTNGHHHRRELNTNANENRRDEGSNGDDDHDNDADEQDDEFDQQINDMHAHEIEKFRARYPSELSNEEQKMREELDSILNKTNSKANASSQHQYNHAQHRVTTKEDFKLKEQWYENKLNELRNQIEQLHRLSVLKHEPNEANESFGHSSCRIINEYVEEMQRLSRCSHENSLFIEMWHDKQKREINEQYTREHTKAIQEYQDKRRDLKDNLRLEYEEMRRQVDSDRQSLDINTDVTESKPLPTRNLRRRFVQPSNNNNNQTFDHLMDTSGLLEMSMNQSVISLSGSAAVCTISTGLATAGASCSLSNHNSSISTTSVHLFHQSSTHTNVNSITNTGSNTNLVNSIGTSILGNANMMTSSAQQAAKRKLNPALITFTLSEDELNDDLKYLFKNVNSTNKEKLFHQSFHQLMNATN